MADHTSTTYDDQVATATNLYKNPSYRPLQQKVRIAFFEVTVGASPVVNDNLVLGFLGVSTAKIIPELCRVYSITGAVDAVGFLEKVDAAGTVTAVSGNFDMNDDDVAGARVSGNDLVSVDRADYLQWTIGTATAVAETDVVGFLIAYIDEETF